jgi:hypothetical protein
VQTRASTNPSTPLPDRAAAGAAAAPRATARIIKLDQGLYAISIGAIADAAQALAGVTVPAIQLAAPPSDEFDPVEIVATTGDLEPWIGPEGGAAVVRAPAGGGNLLITTYGTPEQAAAPLEIVIRRLDRPGPAEERAAAAVHELPARQEPAREIPTEISMHIERLGDRRFAGQGWIGNRGQKLRIEAFSIRPTEGLSPADIEYMAFGPNGRETPWVSEGKLCGTRGRGLPLTGFAVRLAPHLRDRYAVAYQGAFFSGAVVGPIESGAPCTSTVADDPLEAINVRLVERAAR